MKNLSVNINKIATIRNARGGQVPSVVQSAINCDKFGADGITVHPRPDLRHITPKDVAELKKIIPNNIEFNIEGNPTTKFLNLVCEVKPTQVTLVPDAEDAITSSAGWNTKKHAKFLRGVIDELKTEGIRTSIFVDPDISIIEAALDTGTDRIELYTEDYARAYDFDREKGCLLYTSPSPRDRQKSRMPSSA